MFAADPLGVIDAKDGVGGELGMPGGFGGDFSPPPVGSAAPATGYVGKLGGGPTPDGRLVCLAINDGLGAPAGTPAGADIGAPCVAPAPIAGPPDAPAAAAS
jgi:hypothetical protein